MVGAREDASRVRFIQHQDEYHGADRVNAVYVLVKRRKFHVRKKFPKINCPLIGSGCGVQPN